ncbi:hypothetical protein EDB83DRAFT_2540098 [Lactarius deliciosus]|nr:hypothetical protein EDB83DRAFT_2540098 [Lactarius deliciosus]
MQRMYHSIPRRYSTRSALPADFQWFPRFFNPTEQYALLSAALRKLDVAEPRAARKRRRDFLVSHQQDRLRDTGDLKDVFLPDEFYHFEEGHYDGVIKRFRETRVSSWDGETDPVFRSALGRLEVLRPNAGSTQTHLLHLASDGEILPHIDNIDASGSWILGVSLGSDRVLRMESVEADSDCSPRHTFDVTLPSGSVYIQRDDVRYNYKHSILRAEPIPAQVAPQAQGQRLSIMVRVRFQLVPILQEIMNTF